MLRGLKKKNRKAKLKESNEEEDKMHRDEAIERLRKKIEIDAHNFS